MTIAMAFLDTPPNSLMDSTVSLNGENCRRIRSWARSLARDTLGGRGACWNSEMGTRKSEKQVNYSHGLA